jgi:hypothetical protein
VEVFAVKAKMAGSIKLQTPKELTKLGKVVYGRPKLSQRGSRKAYKSVLKAPKAVKFKF